MYSKKFSFIQEDSTEDMIHVHACEEFCTTKGYGFIPYIDQTTLPADKFKHQAGWQPRIPFTKSNNLVYKDSAYGVELDVKSYPLRFRALVPEQGVYAVTVTIDSGDSLLNQINIYTGRRNLVKKDLTIPAGEVYTASFFVHVLDYIPIMGQPPREDLSIYISITGESARISTLSIEKAQAPTLFIGGDSIVADYEAYYPYNPIINGGSWGHNILQYFNGLAIDNQAHGGMTTNCFRDDGHWDIIAKAIRPGDIFMFQFGHNDQKRRNLAAFKGYSHNLRWYINKVRSLGATPIIVTSLSRIPSKDEYGYYDLLEEHALACVRAGRELQVPVIDLHSISFDLFCSLGNDVLKGYFNDAAHTNDYGALVVAELIAKEIKNQQIAPLCDYLVDTITPPWTPDESLRPLSQGSPIEKPEKPILSTDLPELPYVDCKHIRQLTGLKEAMSKGLLDPCLKFYHPFDEIPRGQFLFLFFKAYKPSEKRSYQGKYCDIYKYEWDAQNVQAAIDEELIDETTTPNDRFRPDDGLTGGELLSFIVRSLHKPGNRFYNLTECEQQAKSLGLIWEGYSRDLYVNRADCTVALVGMMNVTSAEIAGLS
ncbi:MAG: rhamnogalacturonan acetylesterase [Anaerocolumna sp.]